ncbi:hypothetical protein HPB48_004206 [Haemaphysalis longicornis]|uniref:HTH CENPB-type domain-containing protein n=1 Tax=Haemaphysalis longicornis TaxID=44386 RepID=A0A9J6GU35_HAELO|nr:hypothetical protein HPB48_004206 [Haemaphysalis longicornis]
MSVGRALRNRLLQEQARKLASKAKLGTFNASSQYLSRLKKRFNLSLRATTNDSQKIPCRGSVGLPKDGRHAAPPASLQSMLRRDQPTSRTNNVVEGASIRISNTKYSLRGITVALCATTAGIRLPVFIILKSDRPDSSERAIWGRNRDDVQCLHVLYQARIHKTYTTHQALESKDTRVVFFLGGCTSTVQPADGSWDETIQRQLSEHLVAPKGNLNERSRQDDVNFVSKAWEAVSESVITRFFKRCDIPTALDGSGDEELHDRIATAISPYAAPPTISNSVRE